MLMLGPISKGLQYVYANVPKSERKKKTRPEILLSISIERCSTRIMCTP